MKQDWNISVYTKTVSMKQNWNRPVYTETFKCTVTEPDRHAYTGQKELIYSSRELIWTHRPFQKYHQGQEETFKPKPTHQWSPPEKSEAQKSGRQERGKKEETEQNIFGGQD